MVNGLFSKDHVYFVDLWITFIHSWRGLEFQLKVCVEERKEKICWYARKIWGFFLWLHFHQHSRKKNQNIIYIFLNHSVNERNKFSWLWETICFNGHTAVTAVRRANLFLAKSESKGTELSGVVNLLEIDVYDCYGVVYCDVSLSITDCC